MKPLYRQLLPLVALCAGSTMALAQNTETEDNNNKSLANAIPNLASGASIIGNSTGSSTTAVGAATADYFLISTASAPAGIYRHRILVETEIAGHTATIRGLTRTGGSPNPGTDAAVQTSSTTTTPARFVQWYGFGRQEQLYFRVTGTTSTTSDYTATLTTESVTPIDAGTFYQGAITLARPTGVTTDYDMWVYDSTLTAMADYGIDDPETFTRNFTPGTYYVAYSPTNLANDQSAGTGDTALTTAAMDFPNVVVASTSTNVANMPLRITDQFGPVDVAAGRGAYEVIWVKFVVSDVAPANGSCCLPDGTCMAATSVSCATLGGTYGGNGTDCQTANCPQPGACCFSTDYTCQILSEAQCATAGGTYSGNGTACTSCAPPPDGSVLVIAADSTANVTDVKVKLEGTGLFPAVVAKVITSPAPTPTLEYISQFDAVLLWTNSSLSDSAVMGNVLADYVDAGGGFVNAMFSVGTTTTNRFLAGRWDATYQIIPQQGGNTTGAAGVGIGTRDLPEHPILANVNSFLGGTSNHRPTSTAFTSHGQRVAAWQDGKTLVGVSTTRANRADLGFVPYSTSASSAGWNASTDGAILMANALRYTMPVSCPGNQCGPQDYNGDGDSGTDQDIEAFFACLGGNCCDTCFCQGSDFNGDGDIGTDQDIEAFFRVLGGSPC
ncbi:MAG TPA: hypothetical protein VD997_11580 [Phycisphaerales bacterium]|nr:hypothetical protein [Phycisphaerales bacterium]